MTARLLPPHELLTRCDPTALALGDASAAPGAELDVVGQARARSAVDFGLAMRQAGYHLFVMGPPGTGKRSLVRRAIDERLRLDGTHRSDWVYVHNFEQAHLPTALRLPAGRGARLRADMRELVDELRTTVPAAFESEEYVTELERLNAAFKERTEQGITAVGEAAQQEGLVMIRTPVGFTFAAQKDGAVMSPHDFEALSAEEHARLQAAGSRLQEQLVHTLRASMRLRKEHADRLRALNQATTKLAVDHAVDEVGARYPDLDTVRAYLQAVRKDVIDNADAFRAAEDGEAAAPVSALARYEVNLVVDAAGSDGTPIVEADLPTLQNLVGRIDHIAHMGTLLTDFRHIKAGQLHRANGGYLLVDAAKLLVQPMAWSALKRALQRGEVRIEAMADMLGLVSTIQLEPQPIPLELKVVLFGDREIWDLLHALDHEFEPLFRVVADISDDLPRDAATHTALALALRRHATANSLLPPSNAALAGLLDHAARLGGDAARLTANLRRVQDVMHEADHLARAAGRSTLEPADIARAITARRERAGRVDARLREAALRGLLAISTQGQQIGQVNGLAAYEVGGETFGMPMRITATVRLGDGQVIDIQRETRLSGPLHAKGVLILSSCLAARFARFQPYAIVASLVFEQTYGLIEGDSASLAELVALMSAIGEMPLRQAFAMTGSVDQFGHVQAIGAVNDKVEGFFDLCAARGLDGTQGVLIPQANVAQLMLRQDIVEAVAAGRFSLHAVQTVDDALEVLTGLAAGDPQVPAHDTINGRIAQRLHEYSALRRGEPRFLRRRQPLNRRILIARDDSMT